MPIWRSSLSRRHPQLLLPRALGAHRSNAAVSSLLLALRVVALLGMMPGGNTHNKKEQKLEIPQWDPLTNTGSCRIPRLCLSESPSVLPSTSWSSSLGHSGAQDGSEEKGVHRNHYYRGLKNENRVLGGCYTFTEGQ